MSLTWSGNNEENLKYINMLFVTINIYGCSSEDDDLIKTNDVEDVVEVSADELEKNVVVTVNAVDNGVDDFYRLVTVANNNEQVVDVEVIIAYYDDEDEEIGSNTLTPIVGLASEQVEVTTTQGQDQYEDVSRYVIQVSAELSEVTSYYSALEISSAKEEEDLFIDVGIQNTATQDLHEFNLYTVFYFEGIPVSLHVQQVKEILSLEEYFTTVPVSTKDETAISYDEYKVYVNNTYYK